MHPHAELIDLTCDARHLALLRSFHDGMRNTGAFDPAERHGLDILIGNLERKARGGYGANNYHILLAAIGGQAVGVAIGDYLCAPHLGAIECLVVNNPRSHDQTHEHPHDFPLAAQLRHGLETLLSDDAEERGGRPLDFVIAEIEDPYLTHTRRGGHDPFLRAEAWHRWGYGLLDFWYHQPALSPAQASVGNLCLIARQMRGMPEHGINALRLHNFLHEYLQWALHIDLPASDPSYSRMGRALDEITVAPSIALRNLGDYIGHETPPRFTIHPVRDAASPLFSRVMDFYHGTFGHNSLPVDEAEFAYALAHAPGQASGQLAGHTGKTQPYHLWALTAPSERGVRGIRGVLDGKPGSHGKGAPVDGMVAFYSFDEGGFGGYVVFGDALRGRRCLRPLIRHIERQMLTDHPAATGWVIECDRTADVAPLIAVGFHRTPLAYEQPVAGGARARQILYRPFGRSKVDAPELDLAALRALVARVYRTVYGIPSSIA